MQVRNFLRKILEMVVWWAKWGQRLLLLGGKEVVESIQRGCRGIIVQMGENWNLILRGSLRSIDLEKGGDRPSSTHIKYGFAHGSARGQGGRVWRRI